MTRLDLYAALRDISSGDPNRRQRIIDEMTIEHRGVFFTVRLGAAETLIHHSKASPYAALSHLIDASGLFPLRQP